MKQLTSEEIIKSFEELVEHAWRGKGRNGKAFFTSQHGQKPLGSRLFEAIARLSVSVAFEAVCLRRNKKTKAVEVFLLKRGPHESFAGQWHVPGSVFRPGEQPKDVVHRLGPREFGAAIISGFKCYGTFFYPEPRGWFLSMVYLVKCKKTPNRTGRWFNVKNLSKNVIPHHRKDVIPAAVSAFLKSEIINHKS
jgi:ADP-ribose pyrophosphatase YjhB (NUDIX family)